MEVIVKFSEQIDFFCNFILNTFVNTNEPNFELKGQIGAIRLLNKSNPKQLCNLLYNYLKDYETEINSQNEEFFIQLSYKEQDKVEDFLFIIDYLRQKINDNELMNTICYENNVDTNKQRIWKYIKVIYYLCKKCN